MGWWDTVREQARSTALDVQRFSDKGGVASARLCNFVTGRSELQFGHKFYLANDFKDAIQKHDAPWVRLIGFASRKGSSAKNLKLSKDRMEAVGLYIADLGLSVQFDKIAYVGAEQSGEDASNNDGYYRAVEAYVYGTKPPPLPEPPPEAKKKDNIYALRFVGGGSVTVGPVVQVDAFGFEIGNVARGVASRFIYGGVGVTVSVPIPGLKKLPPISGTAAGPWSWFLTTRPTPLSTFATGADIVSEPGTTVGEFSIGKAYVEFLGLSDNDGELRVMTNKVKFEGGPGFSLPSGGSLTGGKFTMVGKPFGFKPKN